MFALSVVVDVCFVGGFWHLFCQWLLTFVLSVAVGMVLSVAVDICFVSGCWHLFCQWQLAFVLSAAVDIVL